MRPYRARRDRPPIIYPLWSDSLVAATGGLVSAVAFITLPGLHPFAAISGFVLLVQWWIWGRQERDNPEFLKQGDPSLWGEQEGYEVFNFDAAFTGLWHALGWWLLVVVLVLRTALVFGLDRRE